MQQVFRIGTRDSELAVWQATQVKDRLAAHGHAAELVYIKSEGDKDTVTPLYALGVQGIFTKTLDTALLNNRIDMAVHSMKDVPTQLAQGIRQAAVLKRASYTDILVYKDPSHLATLGYANGQWSDVDNAAPFTIATSSIRRIAQWLHRYPGHTIANLRGNVNTRLRKVQEHNWNGAIFAAAGVERIHLRPASSVDLTWMLPAPAQGAIMIVCRQDDAPVYEACHHLNDPVTALCTKIERDFLHTLMGGCSTPISALAEVQYAQIVFTGNICSTDGKEKKEIRKVVDIASAADTGIIAANDLLADGGQAIIANIRKKGLTSDAEV